MNEIDHQCRKISRQVLQTSRHRRMDIDAILADDQTSDFIISRRRSGLLGKKVQCNIAMIALK